MINFQTLMPTGDYHTHWQAFINTTITHYPFWQQKKQEWQLIVANNADEDLALTDWLIGAFEQLFAQYHTRLVRGGDEPEYLASQGDTPAQIIFAHGYFSSALHEIAHWCIAGQGRRQLDDFGYWYAPDGRSQAQQQLFEKVEIKPQAIECLFTLACGRKFYVSQDNLGADFDTSDSTFANDVYEQALTYLNTPTSLPKDAKTLIELLFWCCETINHNRP